MTRTLTIIAAIMLIVHGLIHLPGDRGVCPACRNQRFMLQDYSPFWALGSEPGWHHGVRLVVGIARPGIRCGGCGSNRRLYVVEPGFGRNNSRLALAYRARLE